LTSSTIPAFDVLFGPAYKGIPLAAVASLTLWTQHEISVGLAYDRKEVKDHGEGGKMVGSSVRGKKVVILDDVMTSGKAIRGAIESVVQGGGEVVGVVQLLDREEIGQGDAAQGKSTVEEIEGLVGGNGRVLSVLKMRDLMEWLEDKAMLKDELDMMKAYRDRYGI
jgi:orotate phosphoribosyltransferase